MTYQKHLREASRHKADKPARRADSRTASLGDCPQEPRSRHHHRLQILDRLRDQLVPKLEEEWMEECSRKSCGEQRPDRKHPDQD